MTAREHVVLALRALECVPHGPVAGESLAEAQERVGCMSQRAFTHSQDEAVNFACLAYAHLEEALRMMNEGEQKTEGGK